MQTYIPTLPINLPNPGLPPEGFQPKPEQFGNYFSSIYQRRLVNNLVYRLPGIERGRMILPGNINSKIEDYKPTTLERILFN